MPRDVLSFRRPCPACGVRVSVDVVTDPDTGEQLPCWWCPACGCDLDAASQSGAGATFPASHDQSSGGRGAHFPPAGR